MLFYARYQEQGDIRVGAMEIASEEKAQKLVEHCTKWSQGLTKHKVWRVGRHVIVISAFDKVTDSCFQAFATHVQSALNQIEVGR
jgi:hypothetical protein